MKSQWHFNQTPWLDSGFTSHWEVNWAGKDKTRSKPRVLGRNGVRQVCNDGVGTRVATCCVLCNQTTIKMSLSFWPA